VFVFVTALSMLVLAWAVVVGPSFAAALEPNWLKRIVDSTWLAAGTRYLLAAGVMAAQLFAFHLWLAAGRRTVREVWPGIVLSILLWLALAGVYSRYLDLNDYTRFYAGLSQLMVALIFFQVSAIIILLGAELNRGIIELRKLADGGELDPDLAPPQV
jgi:membrane protein